MIYEKIPHIVDSRFVSRKVEVDWNPVHERFEIEESYYDLAKANAEGFMEYQTEQCAKHPEMDSLFRKYIGESPEWQQALCLERTFPISIYEEKTNSESPYVNHMCYYYNILKSIPDIDHQCEDMFYAIFDRYRKTRATLYTGIEDFYKQCKIPLSIQDVYYVVGLPSSDLSKVDLLHPEIIKAIKRSLMSRHITFYEIESMLRYADINDMNTEPELFAKFYHRNVLDHGIKTWEAFKHVRSIPGVNALRDANLIDFVDFAEKKGFKKTNCTQYAALMQNGDPIAALKALIAK
jgi:hypothetical protein